MNNKLLIVIAAVIAFSAYYAQKASTTIAQRSEGEVQVHSNVTNNEHGTAHGEVQSTGTAAIGGEFTLTDQHGTPYTQENLTGRYSLVFFGFASCPDMCPTALSAITTALETMPEAAAGTITPVFITVDPARDTPEALKAYAANFHPRLIALTGTKEQTTQAASAFKVYHQVADPSVKDYMVNHSGFIYVMNPQGKYVKHFAFNDSPDTIAREMQALVQP